MAASSPCPKCQSRMEDGFIPDRTYGGTVNLTWCEGNIEKSIWTGVRTKGRRSLDVTARRCTACGFLELYAGGSQ